MMRLDYLCDMQITLNEGQAPVKPYGGEEGPLFVLGSGIIEGKRLRGTVRCVNHARRRSDGVMLPDLHGVITTDNDAAILFHMQGLTSWLQAPGGLKGNLLSWITFETDVEEYRWLNNTPCVVEGAIQLHPDRGATGPTRIYICVNEMI
ncbi:MAG TPA: DUF3237 family protein [Ktedonobacterales bacterium]|jgi:hypothetical protein